MAKKFKPTTKLTNDVFIIQINKMEYRDIHQILSQLKEMGLINKRFGQIYPGYHDLKEGEYFIIYKHQFGEQLYPESFKTILKEQFNIPESENIPVRKVSDVYTEFKEQEKNDIELIRSSTREQALYQKLPTKRQTASVTLEAVKLDPEFILNAPSWALTEHNISVALQQTGSLIRKINPIFLTNQHYLIAFEQNKYTIDIMPKELQNEEIALKAISESSDLLQYISRPLINRELFFKVFEVAKEPGNYKYDWCKYIPDSSTCLEIFNKYGREWGIYKMLQSTRYVLLTPAIAEVAIKYDTRCYCLLPPNLRIPSIDQQEYEDISFVCNSTFPNLYLIPKERYTEAVSFAAVCAFENNYFYLPSTSLSERIIYKVVQKNPIFLKFIDIQKRTLQLCWFAMEHAEDISEEVLRYIPKQFHSPELYKKAIEKNKLALAYIKEKFRTKELCRLAYTNYFPPDYPDILKAIPHSDVLLKAMKYYYSFGYTTDSIASCANPKVIDEAIVNWLMKKDPQCLRHLPQKYQTKERALSTAEKYGCPGIFGLKGALQLPDLHIAALKVTPQAYNWIPEKYLTPQVDLYIYKYCANKKDKNKLLEKYNNGRNNIFTFNIELERIVGENIEYDTILKIYHGEKIKINDLETPNSISNVCIAYDHTQHKLEIQFGDSNRCYTIIKNNIEEYLKASSPDTLPPKNKNQGISL